MRYIDDVTPSHQLQSLIEHTYDFSGKDKTGYDVEENYDLSRTRKNRDIGKMKYTYRALHDLIAAVVSPHPTS